MSNSDITRRIVRDCYEQAYYTIHGERLPPSNCVVVSKMRVEMSKAMERNKDIIKLIVLEIEKPKTSIEERCYNLFEKFFKFKCWGFLVYYFVIIKLMVEQEYLELQDIHMEEDGPMYDIHPNVVECMCQYTDHATRLWTDEEDWISGFLNNWHFEHHWQEKFIFKRFLEILKKGNPDVSYLECA